MKSIKKSLLLFVVVSFVAFPSCKKKGCTDPNSLAFNEEAKKDDGSCTEPTAVKKALVFKSTATWCPYCGDWGATYSSNISNDYSDCQVIELHGDNEFGSDVVDAIEDALPPNGRPHFYLGTTDIDNNYSLLSNAVSGELADAVEVSMAMETSTNGSAMNVRVQSKWVGVMSGEYKLAVYILEDGQVAEQQVNGSPSDPNFVHNYVLRSEASNLPFGKDIVINGDGNLEEFDVTLGSGLVPANCYPVAVIWKKNGTNYDFINFVK
jgi:hypothetical protein